MALLINTAVFLTELQAGQRQSELLLRLHDFPISGVQVRGEFMGEDPADELEKLTVYCQEQGWELHYSVPEALFIDGEVNPHLGDYLQMAKTYQLASLKFSLGLTTPEAIASAREQIKASEVVVTVENEGNDHGTEANLQEVLPQITEGQQIGFTFDAGNWYWVSKNYNVPALFKHLKPYVTVLHLKNIDVSALETTLLAEGDTDWQALVSQNNAEVPIFLEYAIPQDQLAAEIQLVTDAMSA
ncbi:MAG: xylose isomerase [Aerococcus sp.]|nr:xylose isomerase [Aerococcus sp.]